MTSRCSEPSSCCQAGQVRGAHAGLLLTPDLPGPPDPPDLVCLLPSGEGVESRTRVSVHVRGYHAHRRCDPRRSAGCADCRLAPPSRPASDTRLRAASDRRCLLGSSCRLLRNRCRPRPGLGRRRCRSPGGWPSGSHILRSTSALDRPGRRDRTCCFPSPRSPSPPRAGVRPTPLEDPLPRSRLVDDDGRARNGRLFRVAVLLR